MRNPLCTHRLAWSAALRRAVLVGVFALSGCRGPRAVHQPLDYPETKVEASAIVVRLEDHRLANPQGRFILAVPTQFVSEAQRRVESLVGGVGPALQVLVTAEQVDEEDLVDSRGEMTRLSVDLRVAVRTSGGKGLLSGNVHSQVDVPRKEATEQELQDLVLPTSLNAFDRFWVSTGTIERLNRAVERAQALEAGSPEYSGSRWKPHGGYVARSACSYWELSVRRSGERR